jgi:hypothetical protein
MRKLHCTAGNLKGARRKAPAHRRQKRRRSTLYEDPSIQRWTKPLRGRFQEVGIR